MRAAGQTERLERELVELSGRVDGHGQSLAREFDHVLDVLARRDYVDVPDWSLTARGRILSRLFHESDLLVAECLLAGALDGLGTADLAGLLSVFVYEHRSPEPAPAPWFPSSDVRQRWRRISAFSEDLAADERSTGLAEHRPPDPGFIGAAHAWVAGTELAQVVADEDVTGGDFVRTMKQLIDLARQIALVAPEQATRQRAADVAPHRASAGVVADGDLAVVAGAMTIRRGEDWGEDWVGRPARRRDRGGERCRARRPRRRWRHRRAASHGRRPAGDGGRCCAASLPAASRSTSSASTPTGVASRRLPTSSSVAGRGGAGRSLPCSTPIASVRGTSPRGLIPTTGSSTSSRSTRRWDFAIAGGRAGGWRPARTSHTRRSARERVTALTWTFERPLRLWVDGVKRGTVRSLAVAVEPDAAVVYT